MNIVILTLFPDFFSGVLGSSMLRRAAEQNKVSFEVVNIRDYATGKHRVTDDRPFGGGAGMVLMVEPIDRSLRAVKERLHAAGLHPYVVLTSAKGRQFTQSLAQTYSKKQALIIICGHYEGVDERVAQYLVDEEVRIGDYVLTGGEPAAAVMTDAVVRLLPGVLGNGESLEGESHGEAGQLGYPQFTRPAVYNGWPVPAVLLGGNHAEINEWRDTHR
jgi:tRNA (guanine37-N1)-methyltransferase